jgi:hypothetical protein
MMNEAPDLPALGALLARRGRQTKERAVALLDHPDFASAYREATERLLEAVRC